jgi:hypothetical protein
MIPEIEQFIGPTEKVQTGKLLNFKTLPNWPLSLPATRWSLWMSWPEKVIE